MEEIWKFYMEVKSDSYKGIYEVSNYGNVRFNGCSYVCNVHKGYKYLSHKLLHRIVAELFIPNPENKPFVDHIDTNRLNNRVDNLRWVTRTENNNNPLTRKHNSESNKGKKLSEETKKKISEAMIGQKHALGCKRSEETRQKISDGCKKYFENKKGA